MTTLDLIHPNGTTYSLSDGNPFALLDEEMGMADVRRITDRGPLQHGDSDIDFRLEPTTYVVGLLMYAASISEHYDNRALTLRIFRPSNTPLKLRWTLDNGDVRQIDMHISGRLVFGSKERGGFTQRFVVPLRAADPTFYDPSQQAVTYGVGGGSGGFVVPVVVPLGVGASTVNQTKTILYAGTWRDYPIVLITGPITNCVITNTTTGDKLDFTGVAISAGTTYTIDCRPGRKTVTDGAGTSHIDQLSDDSDLQTFSLEADPEAPGGNNSITVTGSAATTATEIYLQFYNRYVGI
jgi:hypothetical protein